MPDLREFLNQGMVYCHDDRLTPAKHVEVHLRSSMGAENWKSLEWFLDVLGHAARTPMFFGYYAGGEALWAATGMGSQSTRVTVLPGSDWDWQIWCVTLADAESCYMPNRIWPNLVFPMKGGWILESPPSTNVSYLYPASDLSVM